MIAFPKSGGGFDPLTARLGEAWAGPKPAELKALSPAVWRSIGDTVERLELLAATLVAGETEAGDWPLTRSPAASSIPR